jgi:transketolase
MDERSKQVRRDTIKLSMANGGYHYGGCFSVTEILITLFDEVLTENDKCILSKGHACWPYYVLLREQGFDPKLEGHPSRDPHNGIHCSTGSLGHGLPMGIGMAMAKKQKKEPGKVYVVMGDGECQEGTTWESLLIAGKQELDNLVVIVDWNKMQGSGHVKDILPFNSNFGLIVNAIGWYVTICRGHNRDNLIHGISSNAECVPSLVIAETIKGKGVSFMENQPKWHAKWPTTEEVEKAMEELL